MNSSTTETFRRQLAALPRDVQVLARKAYRLWRANPNHPAVRFKKVGNYWSARISESHRALGRKKGDTMFWFWIGSHDEYQRRIRS